jgi:hypothetical protein
VNAVAVAVAIMTERFNKFFYGFLSACLLMIIFVSCADEFYFGKSKEDLNEELVRSMFELDSLMMNMRITLGDSSIIEK